MTSARFVLPDLPCPFASNFTRRAHPHAEAAEQDVLALLRARPMPPGLRDALAGIRLGEFTGRLHPTASPEGLRLLMLNSVMFSLHDDWAGEPATNGQPRPAAELTAAHDRTLEVLDGAPLTPGDISLAHLAALLAQSLRRSGPSPHAARYRTALRDYLRAHLWEVDLRRHHRTPSLGEYRHLRPHLLGIRPLTALLPLATNTPVPSALLDHPVVRTLRRILAYHHVLVNDLYSFAKELRTEQPVNIILVLRAEQGLTQQQAIDATARALAEEQQAYLHLKSSLPRTGLDHPALLRHLGDLEALAADAIAWHAAAPRYGHPPLDSEAGP
ncbi:terpene synthase family protein [Streptomyces varsoviensis]|uniref:terpene synthase family protein n=1 Tax=Streptomyces varsoviensis TaxID=67373 RepID=UPI000661FEDF|nr:terpene synthase family protein [Streptomyces varsoviensis]